LLYIIEAKSREVHEALAIFRTRPGGEQNVNPPASPATSSPPK